MNHINTKFRQLSVPAAVLVSLGAALFLALALEIGVFQFSYFIQSFGDYPETAMDLSAEAGWNGEALALLPDNPSVSFDNLSLPVRSVTVVTAGSAKVLSGNVGICDAATSSKTTGAGSFTVNPGGRENTFTVRLHSHGDLNRLRLTFFQCNNRSLHSKTPLHFH